MKYFNLLILVMLLSLGQTAHVVSQNNSLETSSYFIVFDESHNQFFDSSMMSTALNSLNQSFGPSINIKIIIQNDNFNSTNLQGTDLVIITNPGKNSNNQLPKIRPEESNSLENYINIGGSILYLSNPLSHNQNITGHAKPLNDLMFNSFGVSIDSSNDGDNTTVIIDEFNYVNNNSFIKLNSANIKNDELVNQINNITKENNKEFLYYGGHIKETSGLEGSTSGNTSITAYNLDKSFDIDLFQSSNSKTPRWMYGKQFGSDSGRSILIGSSIMFSDYPFDSQSKWVNQANNLELFQNIVAWLLKITPSDNNSNDLYDDLQSSFIGLNVMYALIFGSGFFIISVFLFYSQNKLKLHNLFKFTFIEKSNTSKKSNKNMKNMKKPKFKKDQRRKRI